MSRWPSFPGQGFLACSPRGAGFAFRSALTVLSVVIVGQVIIGLTTVQIGALAGGILILLFSIRRPEVGISAMLIIIASIIFESALPLLPIPGGSFHVTDVLLLFFLLLIPFRSLTDERFRFRKTPADLPLILFMAAAMISAGYSIFFQGLDFIMGMRLFRPIMYYSLYFVITNFIREKRQIRFLVSAMFGVAALVSLAMIIQAVVGESVRLMPGRIEAANTFDQAFEATRILPPGDIVVFVMFITAISLFAFMPKPLFVSGGLYLLFLLGGGVLLTYNRNYWASIIISVFILALLISRREKKRVLVWVATAAVVAGVLIPPLISTGGRAGAYYDSMLLRFRSLFSPAKTYRSGSLQWRKVEIEYAWQSIIRHPVQGIGLGQDYRPRIGWMDVYKRGQKWTSMSYMHNGYLYILVDMGLIGLVPFLWLLLRFLVRGFSTWKKIDGPKGKSLTLGFTLSALAIMLSAMVSPRFLEWPGILVIALIMGLTEAIIQLERTDIPAPSDGMRP